MRRVEYQSCEAQGHLSRVEALIAQSNESRRAARRANRSASAAKPDSRLLSIRTSKPAWLWDKLAFSIRPENLPGRFENRELCPFQRH